MSAGPSTRRLSALSRQLHPEREPFYQRLPVSPGLERTYPAPGWYWVPAGHNYAVFLGYGEIAATIALRQLLQEAEAASV